MKNLIKKNQLMITALAVMLAIAGYLQFSGRDDVKERDEEQTESVISDMVSNDTFNDMEALGSEELSQEELEMLDVLDLGDEYETDLEAIPSEGAIPGNTVFSMSDGSLVLSEAKLLKEQVRAKNKETLLEIIDNESLSAQEKQTAIDHMVMMTDLAQKEADVEILLEAKGFEGAVVSVNQEGVDVVLDALTISDAERVQIEDIVKRKTGAEPQNIVISTIVP